MNVYATNLGYREVYRLAEFMKSISYNGIWDDVAVSFSYNLKKDSPYCTTENGQIIGLPEDK